MAEIRQFTWWGVGVAEEGAGRISISGEFSGVKGDKELWLNPGRFHHIR